jgi:hypothetical protein
MYRLYADDLPATPHWTQNLAEFTFRAGSNAAFRTIRIKASS